MSSCAGLDALSSWSLPVILDTELQAMKLQYQLEMLQGKRERHADHKARPHSHDRPCPTMSKVRSQMPMTAIDIGLGILTRFGHRYTDHRALLGAVIESHSNKPNPYEQELSTERPGVNGVSMRALDFSSSNQRVLVSEALTQIGSFTADKYEEDEQWSSQ